MSSWGASDIQANDRPHCRFREACAAKNPGKHCRPCVSAYFFNDPEVHARRLAGVRARYNNPETKDRLVAIIKENGRRWRDKPEAKDQIAEHCRAMRAKAATPEATEKRRASNSIAARRRAEARLAWCPPEHREQYRYLIKVKRFPAAEARQMILDTVRRDARLTIAKIDSDMRAKHQRDLAQRY